MPCKTKVVDFFTKTPTLHLDKTLPSPAPGLWTSHFACNTALHMRIILIEVAKSNILFAQLQ